MVLLLLDDDYCGSNDVSVRSKRMEKSPPPLSFICVLVRMIFVLNSILFQYILITVENH